MYAAGRFYIACNGMCSVSLSERGDSEHPTKVEVVWLIENSFRTYPHLTRS
jgi:hypothetical protein